MDTPDKTQINPASSVSKFEDSPVFKYIDSLSPIELAKSRLTDNAFSSLAFLSPSSLFPSPQISGHRESRFSVKRHHFSASLNSRVPESGNESNTSEGASENVEQSDMPNEHLGSHKSDSSFKSNSSNLLDEQLDLAIELPRTLKYDCGSPDGNLEPFDKRIEDANLGVTRQEGSPFHLNKENWEGRQQSIENERDLRKIRRIQLSENSAGCDWVAIVSDVADMLTMSSSIIQENTDEQDGRIADSGTASFISTILQYPLHNSNNVKNLESGDCSGSCKQSDMEEPVTDQTPGILSSSLLDKLVVSDSGLEKDDKGEKCNQFTRQRSIRRRCLVFEKSPGFGLHLNSLPNIPKGQSPLSKLTISSMNRGEVPHENRALAAENSSETPAAVGGAEADLKSPEKKRQKFEPVDENVSCKRCNCKRSKCLKLYCDCFAAGLYCIEPCSCQDCFNKPIHENVVLETRRQIESRNPLAFAPKVIRSKDSNVDSGVEINKTPASARHKRGCNCKKSSCLKKYCECFQVGVGCSPSCRCEGCKNSFGQKNGFNESESDGEDLEAPGKNASEKNSSDIVNKGEEYPDVSATSSDVSRGQNAYSGKFTGSFPHPLRSSSHLCTTQEHGSSDSSLCQPKFDSHLPANPQDETPELVKPKFIPVVLKPMSPNSKRVSPLQRECSSSTAWRSRKLILRSVPPFPSFSPQ